MPAHKRLRLLDALFVILVVSGCTVVDSAAGSTPAPAAAATKIFYVDGKTGDDTRDGLTQATAFKSIGKGATSIPKGSDAAGWKVIVKGYSDYVYRERPIPPGWDRRGTASARVSFQAAGYVAGSSASYAKPIVSGADPAPTEGQNWTASTASGVWQTPWNAAPFGYGQYPGSLRTALFQDTTTWLWEQPSLSALAERAKSGQGGYWYDKSSRLLYASARPLTSGGSLDPSTHKIDVVMRNAFLFMGTEGVAYVDVRGFEVRHAANGIAFVKGTDFGTATDNVLTGNLLMGIQTSGGQTPNGPDPSTGNTVARNRGSYNTLQMIKVDEGTQNSTFCDNTASRNALQGIKVQGAPGGTGYTGSTSGVTVCRNSLVDNNYNPTKSVYNNASGITVANGAQNVTVEANQIYGNDVGIHVTQETPGRARISGLVLRRNNVHDNRRFGLNLYDAVQGSASAGGSVVSERDIYWKNGIGIMVSPGVVNKRIVSATIYGNLADGIKVGVVDQPQASILVERSILNGNGGYGLWLVTGHKAKLSYANVSNNRLGGFKGAPTQDHGTTTAAKFDSTTPGTATFLKISPPSPLHTAGPSKTPVGAVY